jgi:hypothetical protein
VKPQPKADQREKHTKLAKTAKRFGDSLIFAFLAIFCSNHRPFAIGRDLEILIRSNAVKLQPKADQREKHTKLAKTAKRFGDSLIFAFLAIFCSNHRPKHLRKNA